MKIEVTIPNNLNEITVGQYQKFLSIAENNKEGEYNYAEVKRIEKWLTEARQEIFDLVNKESKQGGWRPPRLPLRINLYKRR